MAHLRTEHKRGFLTPRPCEKGEGRAWRLAWPIRKQPLTSLLVSLVGCRAPSEESPWEVGVKGRIQVLVVLSGDMTPIPSELVPETPE